MLGFRRYPLESGIKMEKFVGKYSLVLLYAYVKRIERMEHVEQ